MVEGEDLLQRVGKDVFLESSRGSRHTFENLDQGPLTRVANRTPLEPRFEGRDPRCRKGGGGRELRETPRGEAARRPSLGGVRRGWERDANGPEIGRGPLRGVASVRDDGD